MELDEYGVTVDGKVNSTSAGETTTVKRELNEDTNSATASASVPNPFDDPVQRTKYLIQYIRLRKQRAEAEQVKRNALKKQKMNARATLQNAREEKAAADAEEKQCAIKIDDLNREKHQVLAALKAIHSRETERKRKREDAERQRMALAEEQRRLEEHQRLTAQQQQQSMAAVEYFLQMKNTQQTLNAVLASATGGGGGVHMGTVPPLPQALLSLLMQNPATTNAQVPYMPSSAATQQHSNKLMSYGTMPSSATIPSSTHNQQSSQQLHFQQQQQVQNAVSQLLRQNISNVAHGAGLGSLLGLTGGGPVPTAHHQPFATIGNYSLPQQQQFDLHTLTASAHPHFPPSIPANLNLQQALAAAATGGGVLPSPNAGTSKTPQATDVELTHDLLYQAAILAAANLGSGMMTSNSSTAPPQNRNK